MGDEGVYDVWICTREALTFASRLDVHVQMKLSLGTTLTPAEPRPSH